MPDRSLRWWWLAATAGVAAFAVYVSLVPFNFIRPAGPLSVGRLVQRLLDFEVRSLSNLAANWLMFVPFGLCGSALFVDDTSRTWRWCVAVGAVLTASIVLSLAIETAQIFVRNRTPSLMDVAAQLAGTIVGLGLWGAFARRIRNLVRRFASGDRTALQAALAVYAAMLLAVEIVAPDAPIHSDERLTTTISDVILAVPVGVLAAIAGISPAARRGLPAAMAFGIIVIAIGEAVQVVARSRDLDLMHLLSSAGGVGLGVMLAAATVARRRGSRPSISGRLWPAVALAGAGAVYAVYSLSPFDFVFSSGMIESRMNRLTAVPFAGYYQNQEFKAIRDLFVKVGLALPLGLLFGPMFQPNGSSAGVRGVGWLLATAAFFVAVELGQVFLPSRYPDNTDVILASAGVWIGMRLAPLFNEPPATDPESG